MNPGWKSVFFPFPATPMLVAEPILERITYASAASERVWHRAYVGGVNEHMPERSRAGLAGSASGEGAAFRVVPPRPQEDGTR